MIGDNTVALRPFDPNRGAEKSAQSALFPQAPEMLRSSIASAEQYLTAMRGAVDTAEIIGKAIAPVPQAYSYARISYMPDANSAGLMAWPGINPQSLRKIAKENIAPRIVINLRQADMRRYAEPSMAPWQPGWRIEMMEHDKHPSAAIKKDIKDATRFIYNCCRDGSYDEIRERDSAFISPFSQFLATSIEDLYTYDGWAVWTDMDRTGGIRQFTNLPSGNIRLAFPGQGYKGDRSKFAALIDETGNPITAFTRDEMMWKVMHPRTDPDVMGYGWSSIEQGVRLVQGFQNAIDLNCDTFVRNGTPNGLMLLTGDYWNQDQINLLEREWQNAKKGITKAWGLPVIAVPENGEIKIISMIDIKGEEVRYRDHMNMMMGCYCAVNAFPIARTGLFASGHSTDNEPAKGENTSLAGVDDPGLPRDLLFLQSGINQYLIWSNWPHLRLRFVNTDPKSDAREYEARKLSRTWGETRAEMDQPKLESLAKPEYKPLAQLMELMPEDPAKLGAWQSVAAKFLEIAMGGGEESEGGDEATPGAPFPGKTDPAEATKHGHTSGVRRNSAAETASAAA